MRIKMKTGFKTDKFGMLSNGEVYDLPDIDAQKLIDRGHAVPTYEPSELSKDEIIEKGIDTQIKALKIEKSKKKSLIESNEKTKEAKEAKLKELDTIDEKIEELKEKKTLISPTVKRTYKKKTK